MIILDTNVLSALMLREPAPQVIAWLDKQPRTSIWTSAVTVVEIRFGVLALPGGKRRDALTAAFDTLLEHKIAGRIAPFDAAAAQCASELTASRKARGRAVDLRDTMIAGIALACKASLATRNTVDFQDLSVPVVNPWEV